MKQTAVEWYFTEIWNAPKDKFIWHSILEKAKEMEKEQIKKAYLDSSRETCLSYGENPPHDDPKFAELYYKKTMKKMKKEIKRTRDLAPTGVKSTIKGEYGFNEVFEHIYKESRKPDPSWTR